MKIVKLQVIEREWLEEMKRFDELFEHLYGKIIK